MKKSAETQVVMIPVEKIHSFEGHPFQVKDDLEMEVLTESVRTQGVLSPLIVRSGKTVGEYEVISGHRRLHAAFRAGLKEVPAMVDIFDQDSAVIAVVDSNLHRECILPSEKAFAYRMKMEALSHQGKRISKTSDQDGPKLTAAMISDTDSATQVKRYIRLTYLIPELLELMDAGKIALSVGVELSFLEEQHQYDVLEQCELQDCTPSYSQAWRMHKEEREKRLTKLVIQKTMSEEKANQKEMVRISAGRLKKVLPQNISPQKAEDFIIKACDYYRKYLIHQQNKKV